MPQQHTPYDESLKPLEAEPQLLDRFQTRLRIALQDRREGYLAALNDPENKRRLEAFEGLLAALQAAQEVIHGFFCGDKGPSAWEGKCAKECTQAKDAIAKATSPQAR